jgi:hypothetical protein
MTLPRSVSDVVAEHVVFELECIDRMYLNVLLTATSVEDGGVMFAEDGLSAMGTPPVGGRRGWWSWCRLGGQSVVTSVTAARAEDSSTMVLFAA